MDYEKEKRDIQIILLISIPVIIIAAIAITVWFARHFETMN